MKAHNNQPCFISIKANRIICCVLLNVTLLLSGKSLANDERNVMQNDMIDVSQQQPYFSFGLRQDKAVEIESFDLEQQNLSLDFGLGFMQTTPLNNDWLMVNSVEINYATRHLSGRFQTNNTSPVVSKHLTVDGKYQQISVIGSVNLKRLGVYENMTPYVEASISLINANSRFHSPVETQPHSQWKLGYALYTGLAFDMGDGNTISFAVGLTDETDI